ncbi:MAG: C39 family peptidase [Candidatus Yanofskybacteria bacterium]|nr:C39 family peptidase [Candidatus Yanofskybacteria bacterium]
MILSGKKILAAIILVVGVTGGYFIYTKSLPKSAPTGKQPPASVALPDSAPSQLSPSPVAQPSQPASPPPPAKSEIKLPPTVLLKVPFVAQAPFGNWGLPFGESCEEASAIMIDHYWRQQPLTAQIMHDKILATVAWQEKNIGHYLDTDTNDTLRLLREYFKLKAEIVEDTSVERIKQELAAGRLLILPLAGRLLDNPNFRQPGPTYHMLVVRGYDRNEFITNDPGTRNGNGFKYTYQNLTDAIHDYNDGDTLNGRKVMIVVQGVAE